MLSTIFFLCSVLYCSARDTITPEDWLRNDGGTLVSVGKTFELGFFNSDGRFNNGKYIGIWYYLLKPQRVVWVANRDSPLPLFDPPFGVFAIKDDGKLKLLDENGKVHWSSNTETSLSTGMVMKLMDSGNLVLSDNRSGEILWESFHNLTDTFLPGMWMDDEKVREVQFSSFFVSGVNPAEPTKPADQKSSSSFPVVVVGITIAVVLVAVLGIIGYIAYLRKRTITKRKENRANQVLHLYDSESRVKHLIDSEQFKEEDKKGIDVPFFDLEDILAATENFSDANKLGQGGFEPVYKGKFLEGREIAVKRLSRASGQGLQEFKNEVVLIAKLQHRNLVRLLGYCVEVAMSPEYALDGYFSEKSDVFSFGVMVLEIISGKRNTGFYQSDRTLSLLGHAWKLWKEDKVLELMDQTLSETCNTNEFSRCVNVGLLCVQEDPSDRPTMAIAVLLLSSDAATVPVPKEPAFVVKRNLSSTASSSSKAEASWKNELVASIGEGR
ncbi:hypothetical protein VitviT2T_017994 [Vitis vinifera]|uniref:G-type lectin S-receptor-like serine/threonine-protein kinase n=1 Tax=Vitis vinifera TaxID=29760 RepID=A0ABY9CZ94_VITVI|nr:hypothetical protein VitviT2T_017994 [Vitis vinifera]